MKGVMTNDVMITMIVGMTAEMTVGMTVAMIIGMIIGKYLIYFALCIKSILKNFDTTL